MVEHCPGLNHILGLEALAMGGQGELWVDKVIIFQTDSQAPSGLIRREMSRNLKSWQSPFSTQGRCRSPPSPLKADVCFSSQSLQHPSLSASGGGPGRQQTGQAAREFCPDDLLPPQM